jgi:hypothetical protein
MQEMMCFLGQEEVYDKASEVLEKTTGILICDRQIERVCHSIGKRLGEEEQERISLGGRSSDINIHERYYAMLDGGMVYTRQEDWKEMKLGRVFREKDCLDLSEKRSWIKNSLYVAHLGDHKEFLPKLEYYLDDIKDLVIVADGAPWIWNWADAVYPESTQILDYYHAKEHLCSFAQLYFSDALIRGKWIDRQCDRLLNDRIDKVLKEIKDLPVTRNQNLEKARWALVEYYSKNRKRILYKTFRDKGLMIGSGPIEAAHRHVIQKRLKLSGQRWTINGAQYMANLRVTRKSAHWADVVRLTQMAA